MKISAIILLLFIVACNPLKHYNKVAEDGNRNETKRNILAPICAKEFPAKKSIDTFVSIEYKTIIDTASEAKLKAIINKLTETIKAKPNCPQFNEDSLYKAIKESIKPEVQLKNVTTKIKETIVDSAALQVAQINFSNLYKKYEVSNAEKEKLESGTKNNIQLLKWFLIHNWWWLLIILIIFIAYKYLSTKFTMPFKL